MTTTPSDNALGTAYHDALARFVEHDQPPAVIRARSPPGGLLCPGSWRPGELRISPYRGEGALGSACHEVLARVVEQDMMILEALDIPATAQRWGVEVEELRILCAFGLQAYRQLRDVIEGAEVEAELVTELAPGTVLTGHIDVLKIDHEKGKAVFLDWKTGRVDRDYRAALCPLHQEPRLSGRGGDGEARRGDAPARRRRAHDHRVGDAPAAREGGGPVPQGQGGRRVHEAQRRQARRRRGQEGRQG